PPPATTDVTTASDGSTEVATFCQSVVDVEAGLAGGPPVDFATATPQEIQTAVREWGTTVEPLLAAVDAAAPAAVATDAGTLTRLTRQALSTGDESVFESPEFVAAEDGTDTYMVSECGYEQVEITAADYEYQGLPETLTAGIKAVTLVNEGEEAHEVGIVRVNDDVTLSVEEILALGEAEGMAAVTFTGAAFAGPGESDTAFISIDEPGRYGVACFIPEGSTAGAEGAGPPHFTLGMLGDFTVT
ncbi:cupredoxin domain-containing protein, partial [Pseudonocardia abyssalis]